MKAENAVSSSQQKKTLVRVSGQLPTNRVRFSVRIRVGSTIFLGEIMLELLVRYDSYSPKILQLKFS